MNKRKPPKTITTLYCDFEKAHAAYQAVMDNEDTGQKRYEGALLKAIRIAARIGDAPADDIAEMLLKIRVAVWDTGARHKTLDELDHWRPGERFLSVSKVMHSTLASLREDLLRMQKAMRKEATGVRHSVARAERRP